MKEPKFVYEATRQGGRAGTAGPRGAGTGSPRGGMGPRGGGGGG